MPGRWKVSPSLALASMVGVTAIWGWTFVVVQDAIAQMPVMDFLAWRFVVAVVVMYAAKPGCLRGVTRTELWRAAFLGGALGLGYITQTYGLLYASVTVSGFITGMFVVFTPLITWLLLRRKIDRRIWLAVGLSVIGLGLLSIRGWSIGPGELLILGCALFYAVHIIGLGEWSSQYQTYRFSWLQLAFVAVFVLVVAVPGGISAPPSGEVWAAIGITGVLATAVAFYVQTWAQALVAPSRMAVVMTMEPVFAGVFGVLLAGDRLTPQIVCGAAFVLAAMMIIQLRSSSEADKAEMIKNDQ